MILAIPMLNASSARVTAALKPMDRQRFSVKAVFGMPMPIAQPDRSDRLKALNTGTPSSELTSVTPSLTSADVRRKLADPFPPTYCSGLCVRAAIVPLLS